MGFGKLAATPPRNGTYRYLATPSSHPPSDDHAGKVLMTRLATIAAAVFPVACLLASCTTTSPPAAISPATPAAAELLTRDTPKTTTEGNTFIAPAGWSIVVHGPATVLEPPEGNAAIALVDVRAPSADSAVAAAWQAYKPDA